MPNIVQQSESEADRHIRSIKYLLNYSAKFRILGYYLFGTYIIPFFVSCLNRGMKNSNRYAPHSCPRPHPRIYS